MCNRVAHILVLWASVEKKKDMKLYLSKAHSDEDGPLAEEGKLGIIYSSKEDIVKLCDFFADIKDQLKNSEKIHMHFRDSFNEWDKNKHIDIEINIE